jgi:hypothetical protein
MRNSIAESIYYYHELRKLKGKVAEQINKIQIKREVAGEENSHFSCLR